MRIAIALTNPNILGGGNKFTSDLCQMLKKYDHKLALCSFEKPNEHSFEGLHETENVFTPSFIGNHIKGTVWKTLLSAGSAIKKCIKEFNPDLIISADLEPGAFFSVPDNIYKIHYCHFPTELKIRKNTYPYLIYRIPYWYQHYKQLSRLDYVICNSNYTEKIAKILWGNYVKMDTFRTIYPTVDINKFNIKKEKNNQLCYVGRIDSFKGIDYVIDSYINLYDDYKCDLKIVGGVSKKIESILYADKITKRVDELKNKSYPIEIKTNVSYDEIIDTLVSSKILLSYNPEEHFGIVPIEAQAAGCVPIVADGGGQQETVIHNVTGFRMSNPNDFTKYVKQLMTNNLLYQQMSEQGKYWAKSFSMEEVGLKWNNLLLEIDEKKNQR
jgi:glycosyltransferase involved in cell wall biosynthesis